MTLHAINYASLRVVLSLVRLILVRCSYFFAKPPTTRPRSVALRVPGAGNGLSGL